VLDEQAKTHYLTSTINSEKSSAAVFNDIKIVDKTYLEHSFKASKGQLLYQCYHVITCIKFVLN